MPKRKCKSCKKGCDPEKMISVGLALVCSESCRAAVNLGIFEKQQAKKASDFTRETRKRKAAAKKRTGPKGHYGDLARDLHKYVKHGLRKGENQHHRHHRSQQSRNRLNMGPLK